MIRLTETKLSINKGAVKYMYNNDNNSIYPENNIPEDQNQSARQDQHSAEAHQESVPPVQDQQTSAETYRTDFYPGGSNNPQTEPYQEAVQHQQSQTSAQQGQSIFDENGYYHYAAPKQDPHTTSQTSQTYPQHDGTYSQSASQYYNEGDAGMNQSGWNNPGTPVDQSSPNVEYNYQAPYIPMDGYEGSQMPNGKKPRQKKQKTAGEKRKFTWGSLVAVACASALLCGAISTASTAAIMHNGLTDNGTSSSSSSSSSTATPVNMTAQETQTAITAVAQKVSPSVVGIRVTTSYGQGGGFYSANGSTGSSSEGSGVIYSSDGYIITNYHVISAAVEGSSSSSQSDPFGGMFGGIQGGNKTTSIQVYLASDSENALDAQLVGYDVSADLAVLKVDKTDLPAIEIGDSDSLSVGQNAIAIGSPGGLDFMGSVSSGIISGLNRKIQTENGVEMNLIQTDAAINPGNSGGALVDINGKLIGINNSKMAGESFEGMGFSIPVNEVVEICDRIINNENSPTPYLGVTIDSSYDSDTLQRMGYPAGVVVNSVADNSPAAAAGIERGDIITAINGEEITSFAQLSSEKSKYSVGDTISVTIYRSGQSTDVQLTLGQSSEG